MISKKNGKSQTRLPVYNYESEIINSVFNSDNPITLIIGETGCGKTTQIPQIIYNHTIGKTTNNNNKNNSGNVFNDNTPKYARTNICITQPRRVAAISVALRVSQEMQVPIGSTVGYAVRFDEKYSANTRIKFVTDGMLLRECIIDRQLSKYKVLILDEAHERSLNSDTLLGLIKALLTRERKDIKLVVMSATLDIKKFSSYLNTSNVLMIKGRSFPIEVYNSIEAQKSYIDAALTTILQIHMNEEEEYKSGDILVFLPGQEDIEDLQEMLLQKQRQIEESSDIYENNSNIANNSNNSNNSNISNKIPPYEILPIFSALPNQEQMKVFLPLKDKRKIILATNIAETSITIKGIKFVVDAGYCKMRNYLYKSSLDTLKVSQISKNSAVQRAGRAGREQKGKCFRLYTEDEFKKLEDFNPPEILRVNLRNLILDLKAIGVENISTFNLIDKPSEGHITKACDELVIYKALSSKDYSLTETGRKMSTLPVDPIFGLILINSLEKEYELVRDGILTIISLLQTDNIFYTPSVIKEKVEKIREKFIHPSSDHLTLLNVFNQWKENRGNNRNFAKDHFLNEKSLKKANDIKKQLKNYLNKITGESDDEILMRMGESKIEEMLEKIETGKGKMGMSEVNSALSSKREDLIVKCLLTGYFSNIAKYDSDNYFATLKEKTLCKVHPTSILIKNPKLGKTIEYLIYSEVIVTNRQYLKMCTLVRYELLQKYLSR